MDDFQVFARTGARIPKRRGVCTDGAQMSVFTATDQQHQLPLRGAQNELNYRKTVLDRGRTDRISLTHNLDLTYDLD